MNNGISFTIFIPCYGSCSHLSKTLDSLLDQDYELRIVIAPQGNTDVSSILKNYPMVESIRFKTPSSYKTRINLFHKSESDYIYYVDDDDIVPKGFFKYVSEIIIKTNKLDLYRVPLKEFQDNEWKEELRSQRFTYSFFIEDSETFLKKCFDGTYHNGIVHLFIKNGLKPKWFDVDVFQTEDRLLTFSIVNSIKTDICIINDVFYLYRKYSYSHSRTLNYLKGRDDFIVVNDCLKDFMAVEQIIWNASPIVLRIISYLKQMHYEKKLNKKAFVPIYSNDRLWYYLKLFLTNQRMYKAKVGTFVFLMTKLLNKKRYLLIKLSIAIKCKQEIHKYGEIQF